MFSLAKAPGWRTATGAPGPIWRAFLGNIPAGSELPAASWTVRHRAIQLILGLHLPALFAFALLSGLGALHGALEMLPIAACLGMSAAPWLPRRFRAVSASAGLIVCSAVLVHLSGGYIEMHFHFFVMVVVISMYEDWLPLVVAIGFVVLHHGSVGVAEASAVYKNPDAVAHPWRWAAIHGVFVLGASAASVTSWSLNQRVRSRADVVLQAVDEGICGVDEAGFVMFANRKAGEMLQVNASSLAGMHLHDVVHPGQPHARETCPLTHGAEGGFVAPFELSIRRPNAAPLPVDYRYTPMDARDGSAGGVAVFQDVSQRKRYEERLAHQAMYDDLTGLPNRRLFGDRISQALARALVRSESVAVVFVDVDRFKLVNDTLGHQAGDTVLVALGRELREGARATDTVARLGGDEFAILIEGIEHADVATSMAATLLERLRAPVALEDRFVPVSISMGIAVSTVARPYVIPDEMLRDADVAMYQAKSRGGAQAMLFEEWMSQHQIHRLELESDLRYAVERRELCLVYQPEVSLQTGDMVGVEALVRWDHPRLGRLSPAEFIPIAEESGRIVELGGWVIKEACRQLRAWQDEFGASSLVMSINLSMHQLRDPGIVDFVRGQIEANSLRPDNLKFEITESEMMHDASSTLAVLHQLEALGVRLAIDDFGTGYSSLSYLQQFPVGTLKIDRSFLASLNEQGTLSILRAIMALARALNVDVTAEGIETEAHRSVMASLGCERGQGFLFARPLEPAVLAEELKGFKDGIAA